MAYKSKLDRFDMERGDVLMLSRESCIEIDQLGEDAPKVLVPLIKYMTGKPGDPVPEVDETDPRVKRFFTGLLLRLIEHQKRNAERRGDYLAKQRQNANARWENVDAKECHGIPRHTKATNINKREGKEQAKEKLVSLPFQPNELGQLGSNPIQDAGGACVDAARRVTGTAERVAYVTLDGYEIETRTFNAEELYAQPVSFMLEAIGEEDEPQTRNALKKAFKELGQQRYAEACWRFIADMVKAENDYAAALAKARGNMAKKHGDDGEAHLRAFVENIERTGISNPANDWFVEPWRKWRDFRPGCFLMGALNEAKLAAGIPTRNGKPPKKGAGEK